MYVTVYKHIQKGKLTNVLRNGLLTGDLVSTSIPDVNEGRIAQFTVNSADLTPNGEMQELTKDVGSERLVGHWPAKAS